MIISRVVLEIHDHIASVTSNFIGEMCTEATRVKISDAISEQISTYFEVGIDIDTSYSIEDNSIDIVIKSRNKLC